MLGVDRQTVLIHAVLEVLHKARIAFAGDGDVAIARVRIGAGLGQKRNPLGRFCKGDGVEQAVRVASGGEVGEVGRNRAGAKHRIARHQFKGVFRLGTVALDAEHCVWQRRSIRCRAESGHKLSRASFVFFAHTK